MKSLSFSAILTVSALLSSSHAFAAETLIECKASGKSLSVGGEKPAEAEAFFEFTDSTNAQGQRVLTNFKGFVRTGEHEYRGIYLGNFAKNELKANPKYRPTRYKGYSQFALDADDTTGSMEDGMYGQFLLEQKTNKPTFQAHYIFQAGDHMGGTLHMSCKTRH